MDNIVSIPADKVRTQLKWFNIPKGFGFVVPEGTEIDAFLHITTLQRAGIKAIGEGAILTCQLEKGPKGAQVRDVLELISPGEKPERVKPAPHLCEQGRKSANGNGRAHDEEYVSLEGAVKWYKPEKGFGFVMADDGQKDIFIHQTCLQRHALTDLPTGMRLSMKVKIVPKGREVLDFDIIGD
jgi:CspA family cold shock protein